MRDPELVVRAQRAAAELERAWDRWRTMHGLGGDPLPPVSSYVGYSLQEPWGGQPRVVFGIDAGEAEQLASLLDRHDCAGPVYAAVASMAGARTGDADAGHRNAGRVRVPTQAQPGSAQQEKPADTIPPDPPLGPLEPPSHRDGVLRNGGPGDGSPRDEGEPGTGVAGTGAQEREADQEAPAPGEDQRPDGAQPGPVAFRPRHEPAAYSGEGQEPSAILDEPGETAEPGPAPAGWTRAHRVPGGHALPRQKRAGGAAKGASSKQEGRDRSGLEAVAAELAGWAAGELPGQASRRCLPRATRGQDRPAFG